jgi:ATP-dependent DNA ligase
MSTTLTISSTAQSSDRLKINGELVILGNDGRLSFDALQQRLVTSPGKARAKAADLPASYAAFDLLAVAGVDLRTQRWTVRRQRLEHLASSWTPPLQLTPVTADIDEAREWFEVLPAAMGVEGLVVKGAASRYTPGRRDAWLKVNSVGVAGVHPSVQAGSCEVRSRINARRWCATGVVDGR